MCYAKHNKHVKLIDKYIYSTTSKLTQMFASLKKKRMLW